MIRPVVEAFASAVEAYHRCRDSKHPDQREAARLLEVARTWRETIEKLCETAMPSGSGCDSGTKLDLNASSGDKLVFEVGYHHMNEHGMYDGWTEHKVIVTPTLIGRFNLRITGRNRNDIKSYLHDLFHAALAEESAG